MFWATPGMLKVLDSVTHKLKLVMFWGDSQLYAEESHLVVLKGPWGLLRIKPRSASCKANALLAVLSLWP